MDFGKVKNYQLLLDTNQCGTLSEMSADSIIIIGGILFPIKNITGGLGVSNIVKKVKSYLDSKGVRYTYYERDENRNEAIRVSYNCNNVESVSVFLFFDANDRTVNAKSFSIAKVPTEKLADIYVILNDLNYAYRWVKLYVDEEKEVTVSGDAIISQKTAGEECLEMILNFINIIDELYPKIMKAIWA